MSYKNEFIEFMVKSEALRFGEFITKSGRKSPYFINTGLFNTGSLISSLADYYAKAIEDTKIELDTIYGPAYKGIPLCVATSMSLNRLFSKEVGYAFNRKEVKDHGEGGSIVGKDLKQKQRVLIIDDVITAGTSIRETLEIFKHFEDLSIAGVIISVDRKEKAQSGKSATQELKEQGIDVYSIVSIDEIVEYLYNREVNGKVYIDDSMKEKIEAYRKEYGI